MNPGEIEVAAELLASLFAARRKPPVRWPMLALGGAIAVVGAIFLAIAADFELAEHLPPAAAAAIVGGVLMAAALLLSFIALRRRFTAPRPVPQALPVAALADLASSLFGQVEGAIQSSPKSTALAVFAAGCVLGCNPGIERVLRDLIR